MRNAMFAIVVGVLLFTSLPSQLSAAECATCKGSYQFGGGAFVILRRGEVYDGSEYKKNWGMILNPSFAKFDSDGISLGGDFIYSYDFVGTKGDNRSYRALGFAPTIGYYVPLGGVDRQDASTLLFFKIGVGLKMNWYKYTRFDYYSGHTDNGSYSKHEVFIGTPHWHNAHAVPDCRLGSRSYHT
jgi:hypothetical protein